MMATKSHPTVFKVTSVETVFTLIKNSSADNCGRNSEEYYYSRYRIYDFEVDVQSRQLRYFELFGAPYCLNWEATQYINIWRIETDSKYWYFEFYYR